MTDTVSVRPLMVDWLVPFDRWVGRLIMLNGWASGITVLVLMFHIVFDVALRYLFNAPLPATIEIVSYWWMILITFLGQGLTQRRNEHLEVTLLTDLMPRHHRLQSILVGRVLAIITVAALAIFSFEAAWEQTMRGEIAMGSITVDIWPMRWVAAYGFTCWLLQIGVDTVRDFRAFREHRNAPDEVVRGITLGEKPDAEVDDFFTAEEEAATNREILGTRGWMFYLLLAITVGCFVVMCWPNAAVPREIRGYAAGLVMMSLMGLGIGVAVSMAAAGGIGLVAMVGWPALISAFKDLPFRSAANWTFSVIPMFVLMGIILWRSGVTERTFKAARYWLNWLPGGLAVATNFAGAALAATSGSTMGISFALSRIAVPEMLKLGYDSGLSAAVVVMAGTLGQLMPHSILLVIYAGVAEVPVGPLLLAAFLPAMLTAFSYGALIIGRASINPKLAPKSLERASWPERWKALFHVWPIPVLTYIIIVGMGSGVFTATEAGAYSALLCVGIAFLYMGVRAPRMIVTGLVDVASGMGTILILIVGVTLLQRYLALSGMPSQLAGVLEGWGLNRVQFLLALTVLYYILGTIMEPLAIMLLTIPVLQPSLNALGIDMIWFGVFAVIMGELAVVSPPVGTLVFLVQKLINQPMIRGDREPISVWTVFMGCNWFQVTQILIVVLMIFFPEMVHWLPELWSGK